MTLPNGKSSLARCKRVSRKILPKNVTITKHNRLDREVKENAKHNKAVAF